MNKFICIDCGKSVEYERFDGSMYFDNENYVVGFKCENLNDTVCDRCYAKDYE